MRRGRHDQWKMVTRRDEIRYKDFLLGAVLAGGLTRQALSEHIRPTMKILMSGRLPTVFRVTFIPELRLYPSRLLD